MGGKGSGRKKTPPRVNIDPKTVTEKELMELCFGKELSVRIRKEIRLNRKKMRIGKVLKKREIIRKS